MIPKTLFLYWGGRRLSWLRYLTVVSFAKYNPDFTIKVYYPSEPNEEITWGSEEQTTAYRGKDWFDELPRYAELIPLDMGDLGFSNEATEVHKSDIFRLWILGKEGGYYSDFDILFVKPLFKRSDTFIYCKHPHGHYAIGFIGSQADNPILTRLLEAARTTPGHQYQSYGSTLWGRVLIDETLPGWNLPESVFYPYDWPEVNKLFLGNYTLPMETVGVHWYGGSQLAEEWENVIKPNTLDTYPSLLTSYIKKVV